MPPETSIRRPVSHSPRSETFRLRRVDVEFVKRADGRYHSLFERADGVSIHLEGGSYNRIGGKVERVPHDIAHLIVEAAFGLEAGLWGVLAGGGLVQNATFAGGRRPPHAEKRAWAITDRAGESLRQAEVVVRAVADAALAGATRDVRGLRARVGERYWPAQGTADALEVACRRLHREAGHWHAIPTGASLRLTWR